jgi:hypothetical protein
MVALKGVEGEQSGELTPQWEWQRQGGSVMMWWWPAMTAKHAQAPCFFARHAAPGYTDLRHWDPYG